MSCLCWSRVHSASRPWRYLLVLSALSIILLGATHEVEELPQAEFEFAAGLASNLAHLILYGALAFALLTLLPVDAHRRPAAWLQVSIASILVGLLDETVQGYCGGRFSDIRDVGTDLAGALLALAGVGYLDTPSSGRAHALLLAVPFLLAWGYLVTLQPAVPLPWS